ncbi:MAG: threonine ammonia-lyase [Bacteroidales bacterium]|nr:threonine ammonia-lyase [Bacteroidales bacterium]
MKETEVDTVFFPEVSEIQSAGMKLKNVVTKTPLTKNFILSEKYDANILLKREDLQEVRSYKIRGAYNKISSLSKEEIKNGVVCASAGNHAQGVAYSCSKLGIKGKIFMPHTTPSQKVKQVEMFGKEWVEVVLTGDNYDDCCEEAIEYCTENNSAFIHPYDDIKIIEGQGTVGLEILADAKESIDYLFVPVGGGGLAAGTGAYFKLLSPHTKIIGIEPEGAPSMKKSLEAGEVVTLENIDTFVDGAAVKRVGNLTFDICKDVLDDMITVPEGKICTTILKLYNEEAIVVEPAGAMSIAALDFYKDEIEGKNVVCVVSGSNNDITRTEEIKERSLLYEKLKHYFIVRFPQRAGALREFLLEVLGPNDDISFFEYSKKNNKDSGPAVIGIELQNKEDFEKLIENMNHKKINYKYLNEKPDLFEFII